MIKESLKGIVGSIVGKSAEGIVDLLEGDVYINEFLIAKKMGMTINQTRNILYKLSDAGLVSSIRKKDKKKGWYTYFWKLEILKSLEFLKGVLEKNIFNLQSQINSRETKQFFICQRCNVEFNEENALVHNFICQECGDVFQLKDNTKLLKDMKRNFEKLKIELQKINEEIQKEREKYEKKRKSEIKREERKKAKERASRKEASRKIKKKSKKKTKKVIKKKKKNILKKKSKKKTKKLKKSKKR